MKNLSEKNLLIALIALVIVFGIYFGTKPDKTAELSNQINNLNSAVQSQNQQISGLYSQIESLLKKQASIIDTYDISYGSVNSDEMTYEVQVSVTPKEYKENSTAELTVGGLSFAMSRSGAVFVSTADVPIAKEAQPTVTFHEDGISRSETLNDTISFRRNYLYDVKANYMGEQTYRNSKMTYDGEIILYYDSKKITSDTCKIIAEINGKEAYSKEITVEIQKETTIPFKESFSLNEGDKFTLYVEIKDTIGLTYRYLLSDYMFSSGGGSTPEAAIYGECIVYDKNGNEIKFD